MNICLYGASSSSIAKSYITPTEDLGAKIASRGHNFVYGGGALGLMGAAARGVFENGGRVTGVAPSFFNVDGVLFQDCSEFIYTNTMRERKKIMEERADAFIIVPGGPGTFDEFFEILTLKQLRQHNKPIAIFNINGYYDTLQKMLENAAYKQFMTQESLKLCAFFDRADKLLDYIEDYKAEIFEITAMKDIK